MMMQEVDSLEQMSAAITLLFLVVAAVIINLMLSRIVKNDKMSIGVLKALGYNNFDILAHYTKYSLLIGLAGSVPGILLSIPLAEAFANIYVLYLNIPLLEMRIYYIYIVYGIILTGVFCIISGLMGARGVLKIMPADSMRPEAPKAGGRIWLEGVRFIWEKITFSWKVVIRNILRNKKRAGFLTVGIALTYGITMVPVFMSSVWGNMFLQHYGEFQTMDYNIDFAQPMDRNAIRELDRLLEADIIEPKAEIFLELRNGWKKEAVSVIGLQQDTEFYNFQSPDGQVLELPRDGVLLTESLAKTLDVKVGDEILLESFLPDSEGKYEVVRGITKQYLGSNAYMSIEELNELVGEKGMVTGVLLASEDEVALKLRNVKNIGQVQGVADMKNSFLEFMDMIIYSVGVMMLFGAILGFAIVYNVTVVSINERLMEFSSLRVLGFDKKEVYRMITRENGLVSFFGIALGIPVGYGMCYGIATGVSNDLFTIPVIVTPGSYAITAAATLLFVSAAQLATIRKIYRLNLLDALKSRIS
jgi:putative ABC transport system permease protein